MVSDLINTNAADGTVSIQHVEMNSIRETKLDINSNSKCSYL